MMVNGGYLSSGPAPAAPGGAAAPVPASGTGVTPSQTVGPFFGFGLPWADGSAVVPDGAAGAFRLHGRVFDGAGEPVPDALVEIWQADPAGRFVHPDDPRGLADAPPVAGFRGFGRCPTDPDGRWEFRTVKPGSTPGPDGTPQAPHIGVTVLASGLLDRVVTRLYFADEPEANATDPVLSAVDPARRGTLIAAVDRAVDTAVDTEGDSDRDSAGDSYGDGHGIGYTFDIRLQGTDETVFFEI